MPETLSGLGRQRSRWQQGLGQSLLMNWKLFFNPNYGLIGLLAFPFFFFVEFLGPIFGVVGYISMFLTCFGGIIMYFRISKVKELSKEKVDCRFLLLIFSLMLSLLFFYSFSVNAISVGEEVRQLRRDFYNGQAEEDRITNQLQAYFAETKNITAVYDRYYWQARIEFLLAEVNRRQENGKKVVKHLQKGKKLIKQSLTKKEFSDSYRLLADIHARLIEYKGAFYAIRYGQKIIELLETAVELDKENYTAYNSLGIAYFQAPKFGGGSVEKAVTYFQQALESEGEVENFRSYYWLAKCSQETDNYQEALTYVNQALVIYPANPQAKRLKEELLKKINAG